MNLLGDILAGRDDATALVAPGDPPRSYDYRRLRTTAWKVGNFLARRGVREGTTVAVADERAPESLLAFLGATALGATVRFDPPTEPDCRVIVVPTSDVERYAVPPGGTRIAYGDRPADPAAVHFGTAVWSENPAFPETRLDPETTALATSDGAYSQADLLAAAERAATAFDADDEVAVRAPLSDPGTVVAGVVAPLLVGATIHLPGRETGTVAVTDGPAPEPRTVRPLDARP